jgi:ketosteroid isomerase-like protein
MILPQQTSSVDPQDGASRRTAPSHVAAHVSAFAAGLVVVGLALTAAAAAHESYADDKRILGDLDARYQKAVEKNDTKTMGAILADDFILVEGNGKRSTKADLVNEAKSGQSHYDRQEDSERTIAVSRDTAVITAKLYAKGIEDGVKVEYSLWFSDVYVRTPSGWRYFYGQASLPLPSDSK